MAAPFVKLGPESDQRMAVPVAERDTAEQSVPAEEHPLPWLRPGRRGIPFQAERAKNARLLDEFGASEARILALTDGQDSP